MFRKVVVFYDLLLQSHEVSCWHKAKNSLSSYPAQPISEATVVRPRAAFSYGTQKRHFDFVDRLWEEIMEKIKTPLMIFFLFLQQHCFRMTDCVINDIFEKWLLKMRWFLEQKIGSLDLFLRCSGPVMQQLLLKQEMIKKWWFKETHLDIFRYLKILNVTLSWNPHAV